MRGQEGAMDEPERTTPPPAPPSNAPGDPAAPAPPPGGATAPAETELRTFLIADIRGYTSYTEEHGDEAAASLAARFAALVREVVEGRQGFLLELRGDEALAVFTSARQALKAANEIQRRQEIDALPRGIGIGLDAGEAIPTEGGFRGSALNLAARLCSQAGPGQVVASEAVIHLAARVDGLAYIEARTLRLKGLDEPVRAVTVVPEGRAPKRRRSAAGAPRLERRGLLAIGGIGLVAVLTAGALWAGPLGGLVGGSPGPSGGSLPSPTPTPSVAPGAVDIGTEDLPLAAFLDPATGDVRELLDEPRGAADAIFADGSFWVLDRQPRAIHEVDPETGRSERPIAIGFEVSSFAVGDGRLFVAEPEGFIHVFDLASRSEIVQEQPQIPFLIGLDFQGNIDPSPLFDIAYGEGSLWVAGGWQGDVFRLDPDTGEVIIGISIVTSGVYGVADGVAIADGLVWVLDSGAGQALAIDPATNGIRARAALEPGIGPIAAGGGAGWVANGIDGTVTRIDELGRTTGYSAVAGVSSVAYDAATDLVWTAGSDGGVASIDSVTGSVTQAFLGHSATTIAADSGHVVAGLSRSPGEIVASLQGRVLRLATEESYETTDPADYWLQSVAARQLFEATCAPLLERRVEPGADGELLEPLVAAGMPEVSPDGRTYTFTIRDGFAFSPPSDEPVTAESYRHAIERAVRNQPDYNSALPIFDIVGYFTFRDGQEDHISGIAVDGDRLTFQLVAPSPTFLERLSQSWFCPVPVGTPMGLAGPDDPPIPRAGPYYVSQHSPGEVLVLERNPGYPDADLGTFDVIAHFTERNLGRAIGRWERGDLDIVSGGEAELRPGSQAYERWGPGADPPAADARLEDRPLLGIDSLVVNPGSTALADPNVRLALSKALDRPALSRYWGLPTDEVMPATMPGIDVVADERGPLDGPAVEDARALLGGRTIELRIAWPTGVFCAECPALGEELARHLEAVGFDPEFVLADDAILLANFQDSGFDLAASYVQGISPDPAWWITDLLEESQTSGSSEGAGFPSDWVPDDIAAERDRLDELEGRERRDAALALADRVADEMLAIPTVDDTYPQLISDRVGCQRFRTGTPWLDLAAACPG
jgi:class 3 adenylate cyclase/ABC-type transport system substrate-binding protein/streptogramin lyase